MELTLELTDLAALKSYSDIPAADTKNDAALARLIRQVSRQIANHLGYPLLYGERIERLDVDLPGQRRFQLRVRPVVAVLLVELDLSRNFNGSGEIADTDYTVDLETAELFLDFGAPTPGRAALQVTYQAGYTALHAIRSYAPDLELATQIHCKEIWSRRHAPSGGVALQESGGSVTFDPLALVPAVLELLRPFETYGW